MKNQKVEVNITGIEKIKVERNISINDIIEKYDYDKNRDYLCAKIENEIKHLDYKVNQDKEIELLDIKDKDALRIYIRTLSFIFIKACKELFRDCKISIEHSLSKGLYVEVHKSEKLSLSEVNEIKSRMREIIEKDMKISRKLVSLDEANHIFEGKELNGKLRLAKYKQKKNLHLYELDGLYDTFYGYLAVSTGYIKNFDLKYYRPGIIIQYPHKLYDNKIPKFEEQNNLAKIFREAEEWGKILEVSNVSELNNSLLDGSIDDVIKICEALHEKKIAYIADEICSDDNKRIILIAGPSSSGKTTFAHRLSIQLKVNGKKPVSISLDNYFVNREDTPKDESGNYDFESIDAIDLELFNKDLLKLIDGKETELPIFNFKTGKREYSGKKLKIDKTQPIIIEGIHGLNDKLTNSIPQINKYKIYISALTQLNIDSHNRIPTTDTRLLRRIVRDNNYRGNNATRTFELWDSVRRGEEHNIFPFQEDADVMFNSALAYELAVLKKYAEPLLKEIDNTSIHYGEAKRLLKFLLYFSNIENENIIPNTSIIKEFIGGSSFREE